MKTDTNVGYESKNDVICTIRYSYSVQIYNTVTLFSYLVVPFLANLCSTLFIIFHTAWQRSLIQFRESKHLIISPFVLIWLTFTTFNSNISI